MQTFLSTFAFIIVLVALSIQMVWMSVARKARDTYLRDLVVFRKPSKSLSRYYEWRMDSVRNAVIDGVAFVSVLLIVIVIMVYGSIPMSEFIGFLPIIMFVIAVSILATVQSVVRVDRSKKTEMGITQRIEAAVDKIGVAREIVLDLIQSDGKENGRIWYVLYRIAQRQDGIGWSMRDVLLDKGLKDTADSLEPGAPSRRYGSRNPDTGPGIS